MDIINGQKIFHIGNYQQRISNTYRDNNIFGSKTIDNHTLTDNAKSLLSPRAIRHSRTFQSDIFYENHQYTDFLASYKNQKTMVMEKFKPKYKNIESKKQYQKQFYFNNFDEDQQSNIYSKQQSEQLNRQVDEQILNLPSYQEVSQNLDGLLSPRSRSKVDIYIRKQNNLNKMNENYQLDLDQNQNDLQFSKKYKLYDNRSFIFTDYNERQQNPVKGEVLVNNNDLKQVMDTNQNQKDIDLIIKQQKLQHQINKMSIGELDNLESQIDSIQNQKSSIKEEVRQTAVDNYEKRAQQYQNDFIYQMQKLSCHSQRNLQEVKDLKPSFHQDPTYLKNRQLDCEIEIKNIPKYLQKNTLKRYLTQKGFHTLAVNTPQHPSQQLHQGKVKLRLTSPSEKFRFRTEMKQLGIETKP